MLKQRILIADDDQAFVRALSIRLRNAGYEVTSALNGYNSLATAVKQKPDLVILDVCRPAADGFSVQQRIEKASRSFNVPIIYINGDTYQRVEKPDKTLDAFPLIHKPLDIKQLMQEVKRALWSRAV